MAVLDTSAVIAFLTGEPGGSRVLDILQRPAPSYLCAVNLAEVIDVLGRRTNDVDRIERQVDLVLHGGLDVIAADETLGREAGRLRADFYRRGSRDASLGDCFALATAMRVGGPLVTSDLYLADAARHEGAVVEMLPDSSVTIR